MRERMGERGDERMRNTARGTHGARKQRDTHSARDFAHAGSSARHQPAPVSGRVDRVRTGRSGTKTTGRARRIPRGDAAVRPAGRGGRRRGTPEPTRRGANRERVMGSVVRRAGLDRPSSESRTGLRVGSASVVGHGPAGRATDVDLPTGTADQPRGDPDRSGQRPFHGSRFVAGCALRGRVPNAKRRSPIPLNVASMTPT
jgi:hypothetical protein